MRVSSFAARLAPFSRSHWKASSSPVVASTAALQSTSRAPVAWRSCLTSFIDIALRVRCERSLVARRLRFTAQQCSRAGVTDVTSRVALESKRSACSPGLAELASSVGRVANSSCCR